TEHPSLIPMTLTLTRQHQEPRAAEGPGGPHVGQPVPDKEGTGEVDSQRGAGLLEQPRTRLTTVTRAGHFGVVRAEVRAVEVRLIGRGGEQLREATLHRVVVRGGVQ